MLAALPCHDWLVRVLFDYDLIGFQTEPDLHRFYDYVRQEARGHVRKEGASAYGRELRAGAFPIGIDVDQFRALACSADGEREYRHMRESLGERNQIICVDRLDYTKGLLRRMEAYEMLLDQHPEARGRIELLQVAPISRGEVKAYRDFRGELEQSAAHINGRFSTLDWTPVRYLNRTLPRSTLASLYRASRIALVTPMRDGMNLVAKEYVAAQDAEDPGVLVLSRFAGAALQMKAALQVNPYDTGGVANALQQARTMSLEERRERHAEMLRVLRDYDVRRWRDEFCRALAAPASLYPLHAARGFSSS
jgi:trehalose 6-phosphate synthase